jgi:hypothetical protein
MKKKMNNFSMKMEKSFKQLTFKVKENLKKNNCKFIQMLKYIHNNNNKDQKTRKLKHKRKKMTI